MSIRTHHSSERGCDPSFNQISGPLHKPGLNLKVSLCSKPCCSDSCLNWTRPQVQLEPAPQSVVGTKHPRNRSAAEVLRFCVQTCSSLLNQEEAAVDLVDLVSHSQVRQLFDTSPLECSGYTGLIPTPEQEHHHTHAGIKPVALIQSLTCGSRGAWVSLQTCWSFTSWGASGTCSRQTL